jgi:hypothetical protein
MQDDAHGSGKLARQTADQFLERLHRTGGSANHDNASTFHAGSTGERRFRPNAGKGMTSIQVFRRNDPRNWRWDTITSHYHSHFGCSQLNLPRMRSDDP